MPRSKKSFPKDRRFVHDVILRTANGQVFLEEDSEGADQPNTVQLA